MEYSYITLQLQEKCKVRMFRIGIKRLVHAVGKKQEGGRRIQPEAINRTVFC